MLIKLKNGSEVPEPAVITTMITVTHLWESGIDGVCIVSDLVQICRRDPLYQKFGSNEDELKQLALLQSNGQPHDVVRDIVLSAFTGEGLDLQITSPIAD